MSILLSGPRSKRRVARPSVREVCLLGGSRMASAWGSGDRVTWSGRAYRVEATQAQEEGPDIGARYVHLTIECSD